MAWTPISKAYVFSTLKGEPRPVGVLNLNGGIYAFGYAKSWLARSDAYPLDPLHLPLSAQIFESPRLFGALTDSLPDNWGQRVVLATHKQTPGNPIEKTLEMMASANDYFLDYGVPEVDAVMLTRICLRFVEPSPGQPGITPNACR